MLHCRKARSSARERDDLAQLGFVQIFRCLVCLQKLPHGAAAENIARAGRIDNFDILQAVHMAACVPVLEPAAVRAARHEHELRREVTQNVLRSLPRAEAEQELKRAKKEVQTEKLKGAATTAAANIAESVVSLFGSNKVKALERRNEDLQDRILELEEEARQREHQQAKQIQEIKTAYEQQNSKLSEFVDFVKRYFPYVEKMMPTIKFLRDTLNFGDAVIRKLCTFKDVSIKGELYSREFNQHFRADKTICSLKEDKDGYFNLNIDGVSHISWFRRKKEEFMEALSMPKRKQNRSIKL